MKSVYHAFIAKIYDFSMRRIEARCLREWRSELLHDLTGDVLEIGAGTGINLAHYPDSITRLTVCEPDPSMRNRLKAKVGDSKRQSIVVSKDPAELLGLDDESVDSVVSTLVLCSVNDPQKSLRELFRVLKPGGSLILMEHVAAGSNERLKFWQEFWQPVWRSLACNCHLARPTRQYVEEAGFRTELRDVFMRGAPSVTTPMIIGRAIRP